LIFAEANRSAFVVFTIRNEWNLCPLKEHVVMDMDRIAGAAKKIKGSIKQTVGKATRDAKLEVEGKPTRSKARSRTISAVSRTP
jgi:uncharacterized protein YjbJ (UPF0337 family)